MAPNICHLNILYLFMFDIVKKFIEHLFRTLSENIQISKKIICCRLDLD